MTRAESAIARTILRLCTERGAGKTICPSEVARSLTEDEDAWRAMMPEIRRVAGALAEEGRIAVTQRGSPVDAVTARGAIRLSLPAARTNAGRR